MIVDVLIDRIRDMDNPTVVGLDPILDYVPKSLKESEYLAYGNTKEGAAAALYSFNCQIIDAIYDIVPAVKPQIAMYEQYGAAGIAAYIKSIAYAKKKELLVIGDIKRGDIASTATAYANGHIGQVDIGFSEEKLGEIYKEDFVTLNPYLGSDSVSPFLFNCKEYDKGVFVLVKTSNKSSGEIQDLMVDGRPLYEHVGDLVAKWGNDMVGRYGYSSVGAVVGATYPDQLKRLRENLPNTFFLVPGYGAQGGKASDLACAFDDEGIGAIINSSRGIIAAHQNERYKGNYGDHDFAKAARAAAIDMREELKNAKR